jgi:UDP-N-acetylglucosamine transferase subunit ALG13
MIFVIVGTQEPFDRLIQHMDEWSASTGYSDIIAQIAKASYTPKNFEWFDFLPSIEFDAIFNKADLVVSHAGMGSIISALQYSKPIIVFPRLAKYREHRNDHQLATAISFNKLGYVKAVYDKNELFEALSSKSELTPAPPISKKASESLLNTIEQFVYKKSHF